MKRFIIAALMGLATLTLPAIASAHSGTVTCDTTGVVYHYDANFPANTLVTEHVNGTDYTFTPPAFAVSTHTDPLPGIATVVVSATWVGGGTITPRTLTCPVPTPVTPAPPVTPEPTPPATVPPVALPTCPVGTTLNSGLSTALAIVCTNVVVVPPVSPAPKCSNGYKLHQSNHVNYCVKRVVKKIVKIKYVWWSPLPPHKTPGVTG